MKTFETEKHNIPKGATHYWNESCSCFFAWWNDNTKEMLCPDGLGSWSKVSDLSDDIMHEIPKPRTKTEFVKVGCEWAVWEYLKAFSDLPDSEQWFIKVSDEQYAPIHDWFNVAETIRKHNLIYRKVEIEIDERQEFIDEISKIQKEVGDCQLGVFYDAIFDSGKFKLVEK